MGSTIKYLHKIKFGDRLNFESFRKQLLKQGIDDKTVFKIFETEKKSHSSYLVKVLNQELFAQLLIDFPEHEIKDKVSAANAGDSHRHRV